MGGGGGYRKKMMKCNNNVWSVGFYCIFFLSIRSGVFFLSENCSNPFYIRLSPILKAIHHTTFNFLFTHNNRWRLCKEIEFLIFVHLFNTLLFTQLCSRTCHCVCVRKLNKKYYNYKCVNQTEKLQPRGTFFVIIIAKSVYDNKIKTIFFFFLNAETKVTNTRNCSIVTIVTLKKAINVI